MNPAQPQNPSRVDVAQLAARSQTIEGQTTLSALRRLSEGEQPSDEGLPPVRWSARGELRPLTGGKPQTVMHLQAQATVMRECQRCLQPVALELEVDRTFVFAPTDEVAEQWDEELEDDVLTLTRSLDLPMLVEDELLLSLPIVPRHAECPAPLVPPSALEAPADPESEAAAPHPFAVLARLKRDA